MFKVVFCFIFTVCINLELLTRNGQKRWFFIFYYLFTNFFYLITKLLILLLLYRGNGNGKWKYWLVD